MLRLSPTTVSSGLRCKVSPTYVFYCEKCCTVENLYAKITEMPTELRCQECNRVMTRRITGGYATIFRGKGWATKDIRRAEEAERAKAAETGEK